MVPRVWDEGLDKALKRYIGDVLPITTKTLHRERPIELINTKACVTHSSSDGGMAQALRAGLIRYWVELSEAVAYGDMSYLAAADPLPAPTVEEGFQAFDKLADVTEGVRQPTAEELYSHSERVLLSSSITQLKPLPIPEKGSKVRVATLHTAEEVLIARQITRRWLDILRRCVTTRSSLNGKRIHIRAQDRQSRIYSADLSKATDHIPHSLAQRVARLLCERLGESRQVAKMLQTILGPKQDVETQQFTLSGVHMGLGISWVVLSILNGFAAWYAGARKDTYAICGDDLIGYWPSSLCQRYASTLERLGLVVNRSKSFFGPRGVFCENIVLTDGPDAFTPETYTRRTARANLAWEAGTKVRNGLTRDSIAVAQGLRNCTSYLGRSTFNALRPRRAPPGPISAGGSGKGLASYELLVALAQCGPCVTARTPSIVPANFWSSIEVPPSAATCQRSDGRVLLSRSEAQYHALAGTTKQIRPLGYTAWNRQARKRTQLAKKLIKASGFRQAILGGRHFSQLRRPRRMLIRRILQAAPPNTDNRSLRKKLARLLASPPADRAVLLEPLLERSKRGSTVDQSLLVIRRNRQAD
jgi:hypothetical protein